MKTLLEKINESIKNAEKSCQTLNWQKIYKALPKFGFEKEKEFDGYANHYTNRNEFVLRDIDGPMSKFVESIRFTSYMPSWSNVVLIEILTTDKWSAKEHVNKVRKNMEPDDNLSHCIKLRLPCNNDADAKLVTQDNFNQFVIDDVTDYINSVEGLKEMIDLSKYSPEQFGNDLAEFLKPIIFQ